MMWKNGSERDRETEETAVIGANELKPVEFNFVWWDTIRFFSFISSRNCRTLITPDTRHTYCVYSHSLPQCSTELTMMGDIHGVEVRSLFLFHSFYLLLLSFFLSFVLFGSHQDFMVFVRISWYIFHYSIIVCLSLCVYVCKSIKKRARKTLKSTTQFQKLTDYLQLVVCVVLIYRSLCNVRKAFNAPNKQIDEQQIKTHTHTANTRHSSHIYKKNLSQFYQFVAGLLLCYFTQSFSLFLSSDSCSSSLFQTQRRMKVTILWRTKSLFKSNIFQKRTGVSLVLLQEFVLRM